MTLWNDLKDYFDANYRDAQNAMSAHGSDIPFWGYESIWGSDKGTYVVSNFETWATDHNVAKPTKVDSYGGEDMGSTYYAIYKFTRDGEEVFIKFYGFYTSYDGSDYRDFCQVFPKEVTKVEYF
jgi:hypothetical protein